MKMIHSFFSFIILLLSISPVNAQTNPGLSPDEFERGITGNDTVQLLDVRTINEYNRGHIKNALLANWNDLNEFNRRISFIDKQRPVYVYCLGGGRSAEAAKQMRSIGYQNVFELKGGINAWNAVNKGVEGKTDEKQLTIEEFSQSINAGKFVLVDFGASWCPPCKKMEPVLKSLQKNNPHKFTLVKVDGGRDENILKKYKVTTLPVFILFKEGKQVWRKEGIAEEKEIAAFFD